jgi:hypothetical protein
MPHREDHMGAPAAMVLYPLYTKLYFALGQRHNDGIGKVPKLIAVAAEIANQGAQ